MWKIPTESFANLFATVDLVKNRSKIKNTTTRSRQIEIDPRYDSYHAPTAPTNQPTSQPPNPQPTTQSSSQFKNINIQIPQCFCQPDFLFSTYFGHAGWQAGTQTDR
jgi:hypothetical protein